MGCSVFDYVHPGDHAELAEQLGMKLPPNKTSSSSPSSTNADGNSTSGSGAGSPAAIGPSAIQGGYIYSILLQLPLGKKDHVLVSLDQCLSPVSGLYIQVTL